MPVVAAFVVTALASCDVQDVAREQLCSDGAYPAFSERYPRTGRTCVDEGQDPPVGFSRYPDGRVPKFVDEDYNPKAAPETQLG